MCPESVLNIDPRSGVPRGALSLYGLIPALVAVGVVFVLCLLAPLPYFSSIAKKLRDYFNTPLQQNVRKLVFDGAKTFAVLGTWSCLPAGLR